jgi:hypothetical protein
MSSLRKPDKDLLIEWLDASRLEHYTCDQCEGLHLRALQELEGVIDSRLFLESYGLLLTTELEIRPMALLPIAADLGRINMDHPTLKVFVDVVDDATPQLVVAGNLPVAAGLTLEQFALFVGNTVAATRQLAAECLHLDYLFPQAEGGQPGPARSLH